MTIRTQTLGESSFGNIVQIHSVQTWDLPRMPDLMPVDR